MNDLRRRDGFGAMQRLLKPRPAAAPGEACELCGTPVPEEHSHIADLENRGMLCACRACYLLFTNPGAGRGRYRSVPDRYVTLTDFALSRGQWESLAIPVSMVFVLCNSALEQPVAFYPSPAGAVESAIALRDWDEFVAENPGLEQLAPDVEAALIRSRDAGFECHIVPIDRCYELVGQLRMLWRGFGGGEEVHQRLDAFFSEVEARSEKVAGHAG